MQIRRFGSSRLTCFADFLKLFASAACFLVAFVVLGSLAFAQETKRPDSTPPPSKVSAKPEECAPSEKTSQKAMSSSAQVSSASETTLSETTLSETASSVSGSSASEEAVSQDEPAMKLRSSLDDTRDVLALDCSKEPDASSAACQRKQSKAAANQCERTEGDSQLTLRKQ
jgi:hypothetical protein